MRGITSWGFTPPPTVLQRGWTISKWYGRHAPQTVPPSLSGTSTSSLRTPLTTGQMQSLTCWKRTTPPNSPALFYLDNAASSGNRHAGPSACKGGGSGVTHSQTTCWQMSALQRGLEGWCFAHLGIMTCTTRWWLQPSGGGACIGSSHTTATGSASLLSLPRGRRLN
jgi:hypothetical protein